MPRALAACLLLLPTLAQADGYDRLAAREDFLTRIAGRPMVLPLFGVELVVQPDGTIAGKAMGWPVKGEWRWQDGLFCREMDWSGTEIPPNCQTVELAGTKVRFTSDAGQGDSATFTLR